MTLSIVKLAKAVLTGNDVFGSPAGAGLLAGEYLRLSS